MRRSDRVLPGLTLIMLASGGVAAVLFAASPSLRAHVPVIPGSAEGPPRRGSVTVSASPSPTPAPTPSRTATTAPPPPVTATPGPTRTPDPAGGPATQRPAPTTAPPPTRATTAPPVRCTPSTARLAPVADSYVDQATPTANFGSSPNLLVAGRDKSRARRALVRFTFPAAPAGCSLRSATLTLSAKEPTGRRLLVGRATRGWSESGVTWGTAPGLAGPTTAATVTSSTVSWTVTGLVEAMRSSGNYGFVVRESVETSADPAQTNFGARTSRTAPVLTLRWA